MSHFSTPLYAPLFGDEDVAAVLTPKRFVQRMVAVEVALAEAQADLRIVPKSAAAQITRGIESIDLPMEVLAEGMENDGVPVPALVAELRQALPQEAAQWVHWGATSQDIIDNAHTLGSLAALDVIGTRLSDVIDHLTSKAQEEERSIMAARTRSQIATPITFGLRIAQWAHPLILLENELPALRKAISPVQFGGASGANTAIAPNGLKVADALAGKLGLQPSVPWHVSRAPISKLANWLVGVSIAFSKLAKDIILMSRNEVDEARAGAGGGSSTMPQKANPVAAEAILTLSVLNKSTQSGLIEAADHAEERDASQWAVEWALVPQLFIQTGAVLRHGQAITQSLESKPAQMRSILEATGVAMAEQASFILAEHVSRVDAKALVKAAIETGCPLAEGLTNVSNLPLDWEKLLDPENVIQPCQDTAQRIFEMRDR